MDASTNNGKRTEADRLASVVRESLDQESNAQQLARQAFCSRSNFFRLFQAMADETPGAMRRRFLLERAAWQLSRTQLAVTGIALDANYGSLEAFTRAFRKAFRISPSLYRRMGATHFHLPSPNGFHFCAPSSGEKGAFKDMDLYDLFAGAESWYTCRLLEYARNLSDEQLDRPMAVLGKVFPWDKPDCNLREILERMVQTVEVWTAALTGGDASSLDTSDPAKRTPAALLARFQKSDGEFKKVLGDVRNRGAWDDTFVDALCEPPETFSFGGMFAHVITFNAHRRLLAIDVLQRLGVKVDGFGCPSEYEKTVAAVAER